MNNQNFNEEVLSDVKIKVVGVGGGGNNTVQRLIKANVKGTKFAAINTDKNVLDGNLAEEKILIGKKLTKGFGAGAKPEIGAGAAEEDREKLKEMIAGVDLLFITAGMGGGTGTGAAPVLAQLAKEMGILTVAVVTKPFAYEKKDKMIKAEEGIQKLKDYVDTILIVPNSKASEVFPDVPAKESYLLIDNVIRNSIIGIVEIVTKPTMINVDFADVTTVLRNGGLAYIGVGRAKGSQADILVEAVRAAACSPLSEVSIKNAKNVIINFSLPSYVTTKQIEEASSLVSDVVDEDANIISGQGFLDEESEYAEVILIATGMYEKSGSAESSEEVAQEVSSVEESVAQATPAAQAAPQASLQSEFEKEISTNPAYADMNPAAKFALDKIEEKVKVVKDPSVPEFLKASVKAELKQLGIKVELL